MTDQTSKRTMIEPARETAVVEAVDVVVCGGGPAGVAAAIAAARAGASVRLIECHGQLGGVWTSGLLSWVLDAGNKGGVMRELIARLDERGARRPQVQGGVAYDIEEMKLLLERMCIAAGVRVRLHTRVVAASRDEHNRLAVVITESKSGREAFAAKVFIDATGDGDLAAQAGCGFDIGRPTQGPGSAGPERAGETQPMTLMCLVTGIDREATSAFHERDGRPWAAPKDALLAEFRRAGVEPSYGRPTIFEIRPDLYAWMINHEYGVSALDAQQITDATIHARAELFDHIGALRGLGGVWSNLRIVATASQIGIREARRIRGRYVVTTQDLLDGRRHDDAVCRVTFNIDIHSTNKSVTTGIDHSDRLRSQPYDVPYRALVAKDVDGLLLAGRCISGDFVAHSSYRVTGNSVAMGEAAGIAAAVAATAGRLPHELDWAAEAAPVRQRLFGAEPGRDAASSSAVASS
jgi:hypothetical protein